MDRPNIKRRLTAALALRGESIRSWASANGWNESEVWHQLAGRREYPVILLAMADVLAEDVGAVRAELTAAGVR